jgi:hypothetical protein
MNPDADINDEEAIALHLKLVGYHVELSKRAIDEDAAAYHNSLAHLLASEAKLIPMRWSHSV